MNKFVVTECEGGRGGFKRESVQDGLEAVVPSQVRTQIFESEIFFHHERGPGIVMNHGKRRHVHNVLPFEPPAMPGLFLTNAPSSITVPSNEGE